MALMRRVARNRSMKTVPRLHLAPEHSRCLAGASLAGGIATAALMCTLTLPWWVFAAALMWCGVTTSAAVYSSLHRLPALLVLGADRRVAVTGRAGATRDGDVRDATYVGGWLIALVWRPDGAWWSSACVVLPRVLSAAERRRMRVWLRYGRPPAGSGEVPARLTAGSKGVVAG